jgi:hypothetical protein
MISAHYKYDKQSAENFIAGHLNGFTGMEGVKVTAEVILDGYVRDNVVPHITSYSLGYPCPIKVLEHIMSPSGLSLIPAIKELRAITGWGLKESKDYVKYIARIIKQ